MPIENAQPINVPAKVYDQWWMSSFFVNSRDPNVAPTVSVEFKPLYRDPNTGVGEFGPGMRPHSIGDLWAKLQNDPEAAAIFETLIEYLTADAIIAGVLPEPEEWSSSSSASSESSESSESSRYIPSHSSASSVTFEVEVLPSESSQSAA